MIDGTTATTLAAMLAVIDSLPSNPTKGQLNAVLTETRSALAELNSRLRLAEEAEEEANFPPSLPGDYRVFFTEKRDVSCLLQIPKNITARGMAAIEDYALQQLVEEDEDGEFEIRKVVPWELPTTPASTTEVA